MKTQIHPFRCGTLVDVNLLASVYAAIELRVFWSGGPKSANQLKTGTTS